MLAAYLTHDTNDANVTNDLLVVLCNGAGTTSFRERNDAVGPVTKPCMGGGSTTWPVGPGPVPIPSASFEVASLHTEPERARAWPSSLVRMSLGSRKRTCNSAC